jgi:hypothetical protein
MFNGGINLAFKKKTKTNTSYSDPESLFRDRRSRTVEGLLSHQSDVLRRYQKDAFELPNIALELPTGSGKTLVGLLIAEFRRVTKGERTLYLCPTRQLVQQVCEQSIQKYGIHATPFVGKIKEYDADDVRKYKASETIAVAPYSALFNTNPFFKSPNLIVLDDAHASENYVASNWSVNISRNDEEESYNGVLGILGRYIPNSKLRRFQNPQFNHSDGEWIEKILSVNVKAEEDTLVTFLDKNLQDTSLTFPWSLIRAHLDACHIYVSHGSILIRPLIPPSMTHDPFASATQRIFMSATLGLGGDLERITGVRKFYRLPIPDGWDKQGIGRRFFMLPGLSLHSTQIPEFVMRAAKAAGRALVIVPNDRAAEEYKEAFLEEGFTTLGASDIEGSKSVFTGQKNAVVVLANRYDGIDLIGDECRLLVIDGLPKTTNLQETFLMTRAASSLLLRDRIRTRLIQAMGRCTRSATDYAGVIVIGQNFYDWLIHEEKRSLFHPELQGELIFAHEQSKEAKVNDLLDNLDIFLEHGKEWIEVDRDILDYRDEAIQKNIPSQANLLKTAAIEVDYQYALWDQDYDQCLKLAQTIAAEMPGDELKGLRGFWNYLAASACEFSNSVVTSQACVEKAVDLYDRASKCLPAIPALRSRKAQLAAVSTNEEQVFDCALDANIERLEMTFDAKNFTSPIQFENEAKNILNGLKSGDSQLFETAHLTLGKLLGFEAENRETQSAPDPWWITHGYCLVSEDKNDSKPENEVPVKHAKQAAGHHKWIKDNVPLDPDTRIYTVLVTTASKINKDVPTFADGVFYWFVPNFIEWAEGALAVLRNLRSTFTGSGNIPWRARVRAELLAAKLDPKSILETATNKNLSDLDVIGT